MRSSCEDRWKLVKVNLRTYHAYIPIRNGNNNNVITYKTVAISASYFSNLYHRVHVKDTVFETQCLYNIVSMINSIYMTILLYVCISLGHVLFQNEKVVASRQMCNNTQILIKTLPPFSPVSVVIWTYNNNVSGVDYFHKIM